MTICSRCHRPLKRPTATGMGPVCSKTAARPPEHERDLFGYDVDKAAEAALFRVHLRIAVMTQEARKAVRDRFEQARIRLGVSA